MIQLLQTPAADWIADAVDEISSNGYVVIDGVLDSAFLSACRESMYRTQAAIRREVGHARLERARELGVLRLMMKYDSFFFSFLELPELLAMVDHTVSATATLHLQNGLILPSLCGEAPRVFQNSYHQDFPRLLNGYLASINVFFAIDEFTLDNGATLVVPGTHQQAKPAETDIDARAIPLLCPAGSMIVFDSTLWHAAGINTSGRDRLAINHQFTRSYIKQQVDYIRALGDVAIQALPPRSQQLLGWYTRVVTSLDEYYQPAESRLYRSGQG